MLPVSFFIFLNLISNNFSLGPYSLSVRDNDEQRGPHVKHYKIRHPDSNIGYYIAARRAFNTLEELIDYYTSKRKILFLNKKNLYLKKILMVFVVN
jgi:hypothetical protein